MSPAQILDSMILSASGWRGIFALDGDEESLSGEISPGHEAIVIAAARAFAEYLAGPAAAAGGTGTPVLLLARDTRPTGPAIAEVMIRAFTALGCAVRHAGICAAPEIMARARDFAGSPGGAGFVYISASHNPVGHNGLKFGDASGGVLPGAVSARLAERLKAILAEDAAAGDAAGSSLRALAAGADQEACEKVFAGEAAEKEAARTACLEFALLTAGGGGGESPVLRALRQGLAERPLGLAADLNGSARTLSIDGTFFPGFGVRYRAINTEPGKIAHRIVPEGESLEPCRIFLERLHAEDPAFLLGYTPDCDGDRGNLVIFDEARGRAGALEAQEVFALACVSELAHLVWTGELRHDDAGRPLAKAALAVNDPTSLRIDAIARAFGAEVFRAEVGEANVVGLARSLRERGWIVRILGEGSAGGNITHPSAVRDPVNTVMAFLKLLAIRKGPEGQEHGGFFALWLRLSGRGAQYRDGFGLHDIVASLPPFHSTGSYTEDAVLRVRTADHGLLKDRYQAIFLREWETRKEELAEKYGILSWEAAAYQGMEERRGITRFGGAGRGGLRVIFSGAGGRDIAAVWMRGSGTEPVFRIMADAPGPDPAMERDLAAWQRRMVIEADRQ